MILGYIVSDKRIKGIEGFVEQVNDIKLADTAKPILIVGWNKAKEDERYKTILDKQLDDNVFWTFSKTESRSEFEDDVRSFYGYIINNILNNIKYYYINIYKLKYNKIKKLYNIILNYKENKSIYISKDVLYTFYNGNVLGISLTMLEYCGIPIKKIKDRIVKNGITIIEDNNKKVFKLLKYLGNKKYAIPYFIENN